eukprot:CAMPEP_0202422664 /NCGR_PEP_ID=MMETSP1128-20130828/50977_1 /ASSEMBLY_ACC=CAM_ASM_000463 /TAXON_ID=3047 /ORGANISM="Dunaliella tertiolecta, Strain CCMP1320" /LENGTH=1250 /DNA_ID=CAMNT_0049030737 /DNA_START=172 /DNA_END=3923 /DNA_ORIENTATION=-
MPQKGKGLLACLYLLTLAAVMLHAPATQATHTLTFRVGTVIGERGLCSEMGDAHRGYLLFANKLATEEGAMHITDSSGAQHRILFEYTREDDECELQKHKALIQQLINQDRVHFLFGSTPVFAVAESQLANDAQRLMYHCCVGPDSLYQMDMQYVFGIQSNSDRYSKKAIKSMVLEGGVKRLYIFALDGNIFTSSTCQAAADYAVSVVSKLMPGFEVVQVKRYTIAEASADAGFYETIVQEAMDLEADAMLGCDFKDGGTTVARLMGSQGYHPKALWLTVAPAHADFMTALDEEASEHTLSAGQWHPTFPSADPLHGTASEYSAAFQQAYGQLPSYVAAGASATSFSLAKAVQAAFDGCSFLDQDLDADRLLFDASAIECEGSSGNTATTGYERVLDTLLKQTLDTFFGEVVFDRFRRNVAKDPITTQVQSGVIEAVLPLEFASKRMDLPHGQPPSLAAEDDDDIGSLKEGEFVAVVVVVVGSVLIACLGAVLFLLWRFKFHKAEGMDDHSVISPEDLQVINEPVQRWDGSWESGKALYKNALVALEPLPNIKLQSFSEPNPSRYLTDLANGPSGYTLDEMFMDVEGSSGADFPRTNTGGLDSPVNYTPPRNSNELQPQDVTPKGPVFESQLPPRSVGSGSQRVHFQGPQDLCHSPPETPASRQDVVLNLDGLGLSHRASQPWSCVSPAPQIPLSKSQVLKLLWRRKSLQHPSVVPVYGVVWSLPCLPCPNTLVLVRELQELGALSSVLENETMNLDTVKQKDIAVDLAQALAYLHAQESPRLKPTLQPRLLGVLLNKHCRAKLMVPLACMLDVLPSKKGVGTPSRDKSSASCRGWSRQPTTSLSQVHFQDPLPQQANAHEEELEDVLRYGLGMACMMTAERRQVRSSNDVRERDELAEGSFLTQLQYGYLVEDHGEGMAALMADCCAVTSNCRPSFTQILRRLETINHLRRKSSSHHWRANSLSFSSPNLVSLGAHASGGRATTADDLLYELFPNHVADALKQGCSPDPEPYPCVSIFFSDVCGYTNICSTLQPQEVMDMLHRLYSRFDALAQQLRLFKVETVGDAWMGVANLKYPQPDSHARLMAQFAFGCVAAANQELICPTRPELGHIHIRVGIHAGPSHEAANNELICPSKPELGNIHIRVGIHAGPVMGAVVGTLNRRFGLFGDAVNVASRMESTSKKDHIQCSAPFMKLLQEQWPDCASLAVPQGARAIKGKGTMNTFILFPLSKREEATLLKQQSSIRGAPC